MSLESVGFIGIGTMGCPMALNIANAGYPLTVFDLNAETASRFAQEAGCKAAVNIAELAACDVIVTMLPNGHVVRSVLTEMDGGAWLASAKPGTIVIDMSSSAPVGTQELGEVLAQNGVILIDSPVSGAKVRAADGSLTLMIGSNDQGAREKVRPLLATMGNRQFECGALGCGHAMKALNNFIAATSFAATAEACLVARRFGLEPETLVDVLNVSTGKSFISEVVMKEHVVHEKYATGFAMGLLTKDVRIAAELAEAVGLDAPVSALVKERWEMANSGLGEARDHSEAIKAWDRDKA